MNGGLEWIVDVEGLARSTIEGESGRTRLRELFTALVTELGLHPLHEPLGFVFGEPAGVTLFVALTESHLAAHSYPEAGYLSLNLYTCRRRGAPDWERLVRVHLGPGRVRVRTVERGVATPSAEAAWAR